MVIDRHRAEMAVLSANTVDTTSCVVKMDTDSGTDDGGIVDSGTLWRLALTDMLVCPIHIEDGQGPRHFDDISFKASH